MRPILAFTLLGVSYALHSSSHHLRASHSRTSTRSLSSRILASEALPPAGGAIVRGDEGLMAPKAHGSAARPVQSELRWGVDVDLADSICCYNRNGAESSLYFTSCKEFTKELGWQRGDDLSDTKPIVFYDSVSGKPCFVAPLGRTVDDFLGESLRHGWPSFRQQEVCWEHVRVLDDFEVVSLDGTHLGHQMSDESGPRFCINLCSVAGLPLDAAPSVTDGASRTTTADDAAREQAGAVDDDDGASVGWPVLEALAALGTWRGKMHYAAGADGMSPVPLELEGTTRIEVAADGVCTITSSVTMPNAVERCVTMRGELGEEPGATVRLSGDGPIDLLLSEHTAARTLLVREVNATTEETIVSSSLVLVDDGATGGEPLLIQTAHELTREGREVGGVQMWRMAPERLNQGSRPAAEERTASKSRGGSDVLMHDTEAFMYSGSEL